MRLRGRVAYLSEVEMQLMGKLRGAAHREGEEITIQIESLTDEPARTYPATVRCVGIRYAKGYNHGTITYVASVIKVIDDENEVIDVEAMLFTARIVVDEKTKDVSLYNHKLYKE